MTNEQILRDAAQQAVEEWEYAPSSSAMNMRINALKAALAQPATAQAEKQMPPADHGDAGREFYALCELLPGETYWGDDLTPAIVRHIRDSLATPQPQPPIPAQPSEQEPTKTAFRKWFELRTDAAIWRHEYAAEEGFDAGYGAAIRHKAAQPTDAPQPAQEQGIFCPEALNDLFNEIDTFPELNMNNYGDDEVRALNYWGGRVYMAKQEVLASEISPEPAQRDSRDADYKKLYEELLYQVGKKYPNETRHETALRYLRMAESPKATDAIAAQGETK